MSLLLRGRELREAQALLIEAPALTAGAQIASFLAASSQTAVRRTRRIAIGASVVASALAGLTMFAFNQAQTAQSRELVTRSLVDAQGDHALLLADLALEVKRSVDSRGALYALLSKFRHVEHYLHAHPPGVRAVALSQDGQRVAAAGDGAVVYVWDLRNPGKPLKKLQAPDVPTLRPNRVHAIEFIDTESVVIAYEWGGLRLWDTTTSTTHGIAGWPAPSSHTLKVSTDWHGVDPEPIESRGERPTTALRLTDDRKQAIVGDYSGRLFLVDLEQRTVQMQRPSSLGGVQAIAWLNDARAIIAGDSAGRLEGYKVDNRQPLVFDSNPHRSELVFIAHLAQANELLTVDRTGLLVWWTRTDARLSVARQTMLPYFPIAADHADESRLFVTTRPGLIRIIDARTGEELTDSSWSGHRLAALAFRCGNRLPRCVSGGVGGEVILWRTDHAHPLHILESPIEDTPLRLRRTASGAIEFFDKPADHVASRLLSQFDRKRVRPAAGLVALAAQEDGDGIAMSFADGRIEWRAAMDNTPRLLEVGDEDTAFIDMLAVSNSGEYIAGVTRQPLEVFVWKTSGAQRPMLKTRLDTFVSSLRFSPDGRQLFAGTLNGELLRWDLPNPSEPVRARWVDAPLFTIEFSRDQRHVIVGSGGGDRHIRIADRHSLELENELPERHTSGIDELEMTPDGRTLISASSDGSVVLWDTASWRDFGAFSLGLDTLVADMALDSRGDTLFIATDRSVSGWRIALDDARAAACQLANRRLLPVEREQLADMWPRRDSCSRATGSYLPQS